MPAGKPVILRFFRQDSNPRAEKTLFAGLGISADLPIGKPLEVVMTPPRPGEYELTRRMRRYRGALVAK